jgi:serine/threonine-protein kinase SRK2
LVRRIFVVDTARRFTIKDIKAHAWFQRNLPAELQNAVTNDGPAAERDAGPGPAHARRGCGENQGRGGGGRRGGGGGDFYPDDDDDMMDGSGQFSGDYEQYD